MKGTLFGTFVNDLEQTNDVDHYSPDHLSTLADSQK